MLFSIKFSCRNRFRVSTNQSLRTFSNNKLTGKTKTNLTLSSQPTNKPPPHVCFQLQSHDFSDSSPKMADLRRSVESHGFHFLVISMLCFCSMASSAGRKINITEVECSQDTRCSGKNYSIIHVIAESDDKNNVIHYLWSTFVSPTIIVAYFQGKTDIALHVNWTEVLNRNLTNVKAITFSKESDYTVAFVAPAIYEFSDPDDKIYYNEEKHNDVIKHPFEKVNWEKPDIDQENNSTTFRGSVLGGTVTFQCSASFDDGREDVLPHELYTSNSSVFTFTLGNLANLTSTNTRLIFELLSLNTDGSKTCLLAERSLDDEHTPAVFKTIVVNNSGEHGQSYFAWKPVAYTQLDRSLDCQVPSYMYLHNRHVFITEQCHYPPPKTLHHDRFSSIAQFVKGITLSSGMNVSFGQQKDGWYQKTKYLSWSGTVGYGTPSFDSFSAVVWIIIFVGFGAPMLAIIIAVVYIIVKKLKGRRLSSSYGQIN